MKMNMLLSFLPVFLFACYVVISAQNDPNEEFLKILNCIASSGNQTFCDEFLVCNNELAKPFLEAYEECVKKYLPNGIGHCDENNQLYYSAGIRRLINRCVTKKTKDVQLTDEQKEEMHKVKECLESLSSQAGCE
ncbi:uncharacterized protein LOC129957011 [Argiope bruennichi]|uniref:Uncharacterized protein n=1 Tax=Argiope bruennichi TaxID=94029 RepID=A0A8T0G178_ARGBR|nr:uncharacterized protein LOC129957011 [Argiope bruennichi]XP_055925101.1 uncharacterized protein LOC129957011 [Argiope bruennichi]KAF8794923.1 hypothetical protein HNY73_002837 [Argiope bruennichi]